MPADRRKLIVAIFLVLVLVGGFVAGLFLVRQRQDIREEAAVPGGEATVRLSPETGNFDVGDSFPVSVSFNTNGIAISGIAVQMEYPFSGTTPELTVSGLTINSSLLSSGDWSCPTRNVRESGSTQIIEVACANTSATGYTTSNDVQLFRFNLTVGRVPQTNPLPLTFNSAGTVITSEATGSDIALIPSSLGSYTIGSGVQPTATPTPTGTTSTSTPTPTPTTAVSTSTPTPTVTSTPTPTSTASATITTTKGGEQLPDAGISLPAILGISAGAFLIIAAFALAL
jgi:hypothetical protein